MSNYRKGGEKKNDYKRVCVPGCNHPNCQFFADD